MNAKTWTFILLAGLIMAMAGWSAEKTRPRSKPKLALSIKPQDLADSVRAVVASDREVYAETYARLSPEQKRAMPAPCQLLRSNSETTAAKGVEFSYILRSLKPVNSKNLPETEVEKKGLELLASKPGQTHYGEEILGGRWYFTAVYPDMAASQSCVDCHKQLLGDAAKNIKPGDILGGLVVRIALEL